MGILNITPDSFYQSSRIPSEVTLLRRAEEMIAAGADILDIGASSTRPTAAIQKPEEEIERIGQSIYLLKQNFPKMLISLDTYYGAVAQYGIDQGVDIINDISAGQFDPTLWPVVAAAKIPYVLNYNRANQNNTASSFLSDKGIVSDALSFLSEKRAALHDLGCTDIIIDPGFGFGKSLSENHQLLKKLEHLHLLGAPILVGISRKSMVTKVLNCKPEEALNGSTILQTLAYTKGASIFRVHDVAQVNELILLLDNQDLH